jgi:hypothetical protein
MNFTDYITPIEFEQAIELQNYVPVAPGDLPRRRSSTEGGSGSPSYQSLLKNNTKFIGPQYSREFIPVVRKLAMTNPDLGLALFDVVQLTNTGFRIHFDPSVSEDQVDKMRKHINTKAQTWGSHSTGLHELVNKCIRQAYIGGAVSHEWVINPDLKGIKDLVIVNPESIDFAWKGGRWVAYQRVRADGLNEREKLVRLNDFTFKYYGLNSDTNLPYGIPPYLNAIDSLARQLAMNNNIDYVVDQLGVLGFLNILLEKPDRKPMESETDYRNRLLELLKETRKNSQEGFKTGMVVGFKNDHEFDFHSTTKDINGLEPLVKNNEIQIANGLKFSPIFMGIPISGSESGMSVTFSKMLSQLTNIQKTVSLALEYGLALELRLAGFKFDYLSIKFNPSTITDDLKFQQAREIKLRNLMAEYDQGIISQDKFADQLGYEKPDQQKPRVVRDKNVMAPGSKKEGDASRDAKSERRSRDRSKPVPKRRDQDTKPR